MKKQRAVWLFGGGPMQKIAAKKIKERGFKLIITDMDPKCVCASFADEFVSLNTFDIPGNLKASDALKKKYDIKGILGIAVDCHETVAVVARHLRLPGIDPKISKICRYKIEARKVLARAGIPQPAFRHVRTLAELKLAVKEIGLPAAIKATNNSGSRGFGAIHKISDATEELLNEALNSGTTGYAIVEQLLIPVENEIAEQSVETLWYDGKMYWLNWVDRLFRKDFKQFNDLESIGKKFYGGIGWGVEIGHINPAIHSDALKKEVSDMIYKAGKAIGMHKQRGGHILKADLMLTEKGPYILELTPRLSGGWDSSMSTPMRGADFVGGMISMAFGEPLTLDLWHKYFEYGSPNTFVAVLTSIEKNAKNCIGRKFAVGSGYDRGEALHNAYYQLSKEKFLH